MTTLNHAPAIKAPETKAAGADLSLAFEDLRYTLESYRVSNDERLADIETRRGADPLTEEKMARMDAALDDTMRRIDRLTLDRSRPALSHDGPRDPLVSEHKAAFASYVRSGEAGGLKRLEGKALSAGSGPDGGYLAPSTVEGEILRRLVAASPIRAISTVRTISSGTYKKAFSTTGPASGWVAEAAARPQGGTPTLAELSFPAMELYAMPAATQTLLDDAIVNIDQWIAEEVESAFAEQEGAAFVSGDGSDKPKGFLAYPTVADASWSWGNIGVLNTGVAGAFAASNQSDILVDLVYALKAGYRQNASFVMNRKTQSIIRKFRDSTGQYLWQPPAAVGAPATLLGFPLVEAEEMPNLANNAISLAFGDFRRGYLVVDRAGVRILRDPYSAKPYVLFYTTKRVGGGVQDFAAIKGLKFAV
ncbi:phage major capsid protein [Bosea lathyri]|uniref:Phage major capsid protein, HK97 family n=1 Tax=Bosea lathyri TaxID=1036778 RepID=A0A1H5U1P3_9HYPH|nr:phage major capsid protein [Bosea lathyri]SEF68995.1 phage major capsid protein, HK97 family [Bosea lathyri]